MSPTNFESELVRLSHAWQRGIEATPAFTYPPVVGLGDAACAALEALAEELEAGDEVCRLYASRAREVALEAALLGVRGEPGFPALAARRYEAPPELARAADDLAVAWLREPQAPQPAEDIISDDLSDPRSLVSRMREVVGARKLPLRVVVARSLAPLAAIGDGIVQIAPGRLISRADVERTVLHEIDGHAVPSLRASSAPIALYALGSARGSDTQEGFALLLEERSGFLVGARRRELSVRHLAARRAHRGEAFSATVAALAAIGSAPLPIVLRAAMRAFRGGGLGRESSYLPALLEVRAAVNEAPAIEAVLAAGRVSVAAARTLLRFPELSPRSQ